MNNGEAAEAIETEEVPPADDEQRYNKNVDEEAASEPETASPPATTSTAAPAPVADDEGAAEEVLPDLVPIPEEGTLLSPGDYFVELETILPCRREWLVEGFRRSGFTEVLLDQHPLPREKTAIVREHRLIGRLARPIRIANKPDARWTCARRLKTNVLTELRAKIIPFTLAPGKTYECRFLSRMKSQPTREMVEADLDEMGWDILKLSALRRDMRIAERDKTSVTLWFGLLTWEETESYVTEEDPFYFDDVTQV